MISLTKKQYDCIECGHRGSHTSVIKDNKCIPVEFLLEHVEGADCISDNALYGYSIERDDIGVILHKKVHKMCCDKCSSKQIVQFVDVVWENVLNFFPESEAGKWYDAMN